MIAAAPILGAYFDGQPASTYYRLRLPLGAIGGAVAPFYAMEVDQVRAARAVVVSRWSARPGSPAGLQAKVVEALRRDCGRVLIDWDDDWRALPAGTRKDLIHAGAADAAARAADGLICTNPTLAGRLRHLNRDVRVLPNYIDPGAWPEPAPQPAGLPWVVLAGSSTHAEDWRIVAPALRDLRPLLRLRTVGFCPPYLEPDEHIPWVPLEGYPAMLQGAAVGLCPLPRTAFNVCKSPIKLYEYALGGMAVIGSETQYGPVLRAAGLGHAVAGDWRDLLEHYLTDPAARAADAATLRRYVVQHLDVRRHTEAIRAAYAA